MVRKEKEKIPEFDREKQRRERKLREDLKRKRRNKSDEGEDG